MDTGQQMGEQSFIPESSLSFDMNMLVPIAAACPVPNTDGRVLGLGGGTGELFNVSADELRSGILAVNSLQGSFEPVENVEHAMEAVINSHEQSTPVARIPHPIEPSIDATPRRSILFLAL